ncbi:MAG: hypothetical protein N2V78_05540 [Methanophagales archaeon]|nr:hypothetical protein [Methanophagales archaeon]MCW3141286.1 hypothetical protein [Methanophagales archaeon]
MRTEIALLWDKDTLFEDYLIDRGFTCEVVMPNTLSAPFFSFTGYKLVIVPAGFGNELYSGMLKALRANSELIKDFVKAGGALLVSGALSNKNAYNWLPIKIEYVMEKRRVRIEVVKEHKAAVIVEKEECMCDGYFTEIGAGGEVILSEKEKNKDRKVILVVSEYGAGEIIATTIHEYPSERFIAYCVVK